MTPELMALIGSVIEALLPVAVQAVQKALEGDPDPLSGLLQEHVADTVPEPIKSRIALQAAEAMDAAAAATKKT